MEQEEDFTVIGWQGISVWVPEDWTLAAVGGDRKSGYLRVDGLRMPRLQVKWSNRHIDLEKKREEYIKRLKKGARRRRGGLDVTTDVKVISKRSKPKKDIATFAWRGRECGMGVLWNCEVCGRALIAQAGWRADEEGRETAQEVLESLDDHGIEGWDTWAVDGLAFLAPTEFELDKWRRMTRYIDLALTKGEARLRVARWGVVPLVLEGRSVQDWYKEENRGRRDVDWQAEQAEIKGHEGVVVKGRRRRFAGELRDAAARTVRRRPTSEFHGRAWHCPESNRLYLVENLHASGDGVLGGVVDSITCHTE